MGVVLEDPVWYQMVARHATVTKCVTPMETVVPILKRQDASLVQNQSVKSLAYIYII